jgi:putative membrane protein
LVAPLIAVALGWTPWWPDTGWLVQGSETDVSRAVYGYAAAQAVLFAAVAGIVSIAAVKHALTPAPLKRARVRRMAVELFMTHGLQATEDRTGVLLYASLAEHRVEVVADQTIHAQVDQDVWGDAAAALTSGLATGQVAAGFAEAVRRCGAVLAERFPAKAGNRNELPDRIVVI